MKYLKIFYYRVRPDMVNRHLIIQAKAKKLYEKYLSSPPVHLRSGGDPFQWIELHWFASHEECQRITAEIAQDHSLNQLWHQFQATLDLKTFAPQVHEYFEGELHESMNLPEQPSPIVTPPAEPSQQSTPPQQPTVPQEEEEVVETASNLDQGMEPVDEQVYEQNQEAVVPEEPNMSDDELENSSQEETEAVVAEAESETPDNALPIDEAPSEISFLDDIPDENDQLEVSAEDYDDDDDQDTEEEIDITLDDIDNDDLNNDASGIDATEHDVTEHLVLEQEAEDDDDGEEHAESEIELESSNPSFDESDFSFAEKEKSTEIVQEENESSPMQVQRRYDPFEDEEFQLPPSFTSDPDNKDSE